MSTAAPMLYLVPAGLPPGGPPLAAAYDKLAPTLGAWLADPTLLEPPEAVLPRFAWRGFITLYSAPDKAGKSTLATALVAAASRGEALVPGDPPPNGPQRTLWLCLEEHVSTLVQRFKDANADPNNVRVMAFPPEPRTDMKRLIQLWAPDLVVIDTLVRYASRDVSQGGDAQAWSKVLSDFIGMARMARGPAILLLHHARRRDGQARDSGDIPGASDVILEQKKRPTGGWPVQEFTVRARFPLEDFALRRQQDGTYRATELKRDEDDVEDGDAAEATALRTAIWQVVTAKPGCSQNYVERHVKGRVAKTRRTVRYMIEDEALRWDINPETRKKGLYPVVLTASR